jgi:hypothetical protein
MSPISLRKKIATLLLAAMLAGAPGASEAGGGPQNLLLVVNPRSWASLTIANRYVAQRNIPAGNVLYLDWPLSPVDATDVETFRNQVLQPVLEAIENRGLAGQIDYVAYSADFPYRIDAAKDPPNQKLGLGFAPYGSINSLTYLWALVRSKQASPALLESNFYYSPIANGEPPATRAFHLTRGWNVQGEAVEEGGQHYLLSTMLAMTVGRGNSVSEALDYLERSAEADATGPKGTIYYCSTADIRTKTREPLYAPAVAALRQLGVTAEVVHGVLPENKKDVQGLAFGAATYVWPRSGSTILPGAICENLTSTSGLLHDSGNQTSMCELLRAGAAGTSGTIVEPGAIPQKFPSPFIQVHYARGCSLAEAFYQSVHGPFQLLIVGDPLCQPWARPPRVDFTGVDSPTVSGRLTVIPSATSPDGNEVRRFELLVDGRRVHAATLGESLDFDTTQAVDGSHELTVVAIDPSVIEMQGRKSATITIQNRQHQVTLGAESRRLKYGQAAKLRVDGGNGAARIVIFQNSRAVGQVEGSSGELAIDNRVLGMGPVRLQAVSLDGSGKALAISAPLEISIEPADALPGQKPPRGKNTYPGLALALASGRRVPIQETGAHDWLEQAGVGKDEKFTLSGYVDVPKQDVYQFVFAHFGSLAIQVDGYPVYKGTTAPQAQMPWHYVPVSMASGTHRVEISGQAAGRPRLQMRFGGPGAWLIGKRQFRHDG